jgi:hypothetical protein
MLSTEQWLQIYFRKLGGASVDTPDLGPLTKLGMGRKTGKPVHIPKAAAALPEMGGSSALAAEFGAPSSHLPVVSNGAAVATHGTDGSASSTQVAGPSDGAQAEQQAAADADAGIVGGLVVSEADMQGVAGEELEYLQRRCKRKRLPQTAGSQ